MREVFFMPNWKMKEKFPAKNTTILDSEKRKVPSSPLFLPSISSSQPRTDDATL